MNGNATTILGAAALAAISYLLGNFIELPGRTRDDLSILAGDIKAIRVSIEGVERRLDRIEDQVWPVTR